MSKYIEVEITRCQGTVVFLRVPDSFEIRNVPNLRAMLAEAAEETCDRLDWDDEGWKDTVEMQSCRQVDRSEAESYDVYEVES